MIEILFILDQQFKTYSLNFTLSATLFPREGIHLIFLDGCIVGNICVNQFEYVSVDDDRICNLRFLFDLVS